MSVFIIEERTRIREGLLDQARRDPRVIAGAEIGSLALVAGNAGRISHQ